MLYSRRSFRQDSIIVTAPTIGEWGKREFDFVTRALRPTGYLGVLKRGICVLCLTTAVLGVIMQFHPLGPRGLEARTIHGAILVSAVVVGWWWLVRPWPGYRSAIAFLIWADVGVIVAAAMTSASSARLCATIHMGLIGVFATFLLGWRILVLHCALATSAIVGFTMWGVLHDHAGFFDLFIYYAPALSTVVVLPLVIQAVIEAGRRSIGRVAVQAARDPLTGLLNRRGMYAAADAKMETMSAESVVVAVAAIDVDQFKKLNDGHGHSIGDAALRVIADRLRTMIRPTDIAARIGGDEFVIIVYLHDDTGLDAFVERCAELLVNHTEGVLVSTSVGIAWEATTERNINLDDLLHNADSAMYRAKRGGGNLLVVQTI